MDIKNDEISSGPKKTRRYYDREFINKVVHDVEQGLPEAVARVEYQVNYWTLREWLDRYASTEYLQSRKKNVSIQQKRTIARAVQDGRLTRQEACRTYDVAKSTLRDWLQYFSRENAEIAVCNASPEMKKKSKQTDSAMDSSSELKALRKQLEDERLKVAALNTLIDVAEEQLKINIRKKPGARQS